MGICYNDDKTPYRGKVLPYHEQPATEYWLKHYENSLMLDFMAKNETDFKMKSEANRELAIANQKMNFWKRHVNYDHDMAIRGAEQLKKLWRQ